MLVNGSRSRAGDSETLTATVRAGQSSINWLKKIKIFLDNQLRGLQLATIWCALYAKNQPPPLSSYCYRQFNRAGCHLCSRPGVCVVEIAFRLQRYAWKHAVSADCLQVLPEQNCSSVGQSGPFGRSEVDAGGNDRRGTGACAFAGAMLALRERGARRFRDH